MPILLRSLSQVTVTLLYNCIIPLSIRSAKATVNNAFNNAHPCHSGLVAAISLDSRQKVFLPTEGCADNITLLDVIVRSAHDNCKSCHIALLPVSKSFDSHIHLWRTRCVLKTFTLIEYIQYYKTSKTYLSGEGLLSDLITPLTRRKAKRSSIVDTF